MMASVQFFHKPIAYADVYVDDFISMAQSESNKASVQCCLMHNIHTIFHPNESTDAPECKDPISVKNMVGHYQNTPWVECGYSERATHTAHSLGQEAT